MTPAAFRAAACSADVRNRARTILYLAVVHSRIHDPRDESPSIRCESRVFKGLVSTIDELGTISYGDNREIDELFQYHVVATEG